MVVLADILKLTLLVFGVKNGIIMINIKRIEVISDGKRAAAYADDCRCRLSSKIRAGGPYRNIEGSSES